MCNKHLLKKFAQAGQTSTEYIMLLLVIVMLMRGVMKRVEQFVIGGDKSLLKNLTDGEKMYFEGSFQRFPIRK